MRFSNMFSNLIFKNFLFFFNSFVSFCFKMWYNSLVDFSLKNRFWLHMFWKSMNYLMKLVEIYVFELFPVVSRIWMKMRWYDFLNGFFSVRKDSSCDIRLRIVSFFLWTCAINFITGEWHASGWDGSLQNTLLQCLHWSGSTKSCVTLIYFSVKFWCAAMVFFDDVDTAGAKIFFDDDKIGEGNWCVILFSWRWDVCSLYRIW